MNTAKKCLAIGCNRKTRTPFCWQHADMAKHVISTHVSKSAVSHDDAYITELAIQDMEKQASHRG